MTRRRWRSWRASPGRRGCRCTWTGRASPTRWRALGCSPAELTWKAGVDVLSFGGTKNGCLGVEAVVLFDPGRAWEFELRRKRGGHLFSKHRFLAAQMEAYLEGDLWLDLAEAGRTRGRGSSRRGSRRCRARRWCIRPRPTRSSPPGRGRGTGRRRRRGRIIISGRRSQSLEGPAEEPLSARLVCNWATPPAEVAQFLGPARGRRPRMAIRPERRRRPAPSWHRNHRRGARGARRGPSRSGRPDAIDCGDPPRIARHHRPDRADRRSARQGEVRGVGRRSRVVGATSGAGRRPNTSRRCAPACPTARRCRHADATSPSVLSHLAAARLAEAFRLRRAARIGRLRRRFSGPGEAPVGEEPLHGAGTSRDCVTTPAAGGAASRLARGRSCRSSEARARKPHDSLAVAMVNGDCWSMHTCHAQAHAPRVCAAGVRAGGTG